VSEITQGTAIELQHVNVKLFLDADELDLEPLVPIFNEWIQQQICDELLLDIADYRHVPAGPGIVLIGHEANYSVDNTENRLGVRYNRKAALPGSNQDRLVQAARAALTACRRLENEPRLGGKLRFGGHEVEVTINDRLLAPNTPETREAIHASGDLLAFYRKLFLAPDVQFVYPADPRSLFGVSVRSAGAFSVSDLLANLGS
jgi:hypothetical protein